MVNILVWLLRNGRIKECIQRSLERENKKNINEILEKRIPDSPDHDERGWPGDGRYIKNGHYKTMLFRYMFVGRYICKGKKILETCCGLGWGAHLVSQYARTVTAFDIDAAAIAFCKETWRNDSIIWLSGDASDLSFLGKEQYDVVLAMETIEHFTKKGGEKYVAEVAARLRGGGIFIGTSVFPAARHEASMLEKNNPHHLHIFTFEEMASILACHFKEFDIISNWMFVAKK